jgi:hypothetical protein
MKDPRKPDTQEDQYLPDLPNAHRTPAFDNPQAGPEPRRGATTNPNPEGDAVNPIDTSSMPRGEDDDKTWHDSPEFHDRPGGPWSPDKV